MSLRSFHIFFIVTALGLVGFFVTWSTRLYLHDAGSQYLGLAISAGICLAAGIPYLYWFVGKDPTDARS